ncbi:MAG: hypothetical protein J0I12_12680 [Candidatus Eremiobacteraeota bacterium]|nr:hypothetical protein [Candidatus Eremiobacteraeota bacterium]
MTEPIFEVRFQELLGERPVRQESRAAVIFLQALFDEAGQFYEEEEAA